MDKQLDTLQQFEKLWNKVDSQKTGELDYHQVRSLLRTFSQEIKKEFSEALVNDLIQKADLKTGTSHKGKIVKYALKELLFPKGDKVEFVKFQKKEEFPLEKEEEERKRKLAESREKASEIQRVRDEEQTNREKEEAIHREEKINTHWTQTKHQLVSYLGDIKALPVTDRLALFSTLEAYVRNILATTSAATFEKFRKIPVSNNKFQQNVLRLPVGSKLIEAIGFEKKSLESSLAYEQKTGLNSQVFYVLKDLETTIPILKKCHFFLCKYIQKWSQEVAVVVISYPGKQISLKEALKNFKLQNLQTDWKAGLEALCKYLINIIAYPENEKFRNISLLGKGFAMNLGQFHGSYALMRAIGFSHNSNGILSIPLEKVTELDEILKLLQQHQTLKVKNPQWLTGKIPRAERFVAVMVGASTGDAIGYQNGFWVNPEKSGEEIWEDCQKKGGLVHLGGGKLTLTGDTWMHLATGEALLKGGNIVDCFITKYKECCKLFLTPGTPWFEALSSYDPKSPKTFTGNSGNMGNSVATRSMCIGLFFWHPSQLDQLILTTALCTHVTHTHPVAFLGGFVSALFTSFAIQALPVREWGIEMVGLLPRVKKCLSHSGINIHEGEEQFQIFEKNWRGYLDTRGIQTKGKVESKVLFPQDYGFKSRDGFYGARSLGSVSGASGYDCCLIAYDAILWASQFYKKQEMLNNKIFVNDGSEGWFELLQHAAMHQGATNDTATLACAWYGGQNGLRGIPVQNYKALDSLWRIQNLGNALYSAKGYVKEGVVDS